MLSRTPNIKVFYRYSIRATNNLLFAICDKLDNCITGYIDYSDIIKERPVKKLLYNAYYRNTKDGKLRVNKYL